MSMRNELQQLPQVKLRPIFVDVMPPFEAIKEGELWISHKHRPLICAVRVVVAN